MRQLGGKSTKPKGDERDCFYHNHEERREQMRQTETDSMAGTGDAQTEDERA